MAGETDCYTFVGAVSDMIRIRVVETSAHVNETSGTLPARQDISRPNGSFACGQTTAVDLACALEADGNWVLIVGDNSGTKTGNYNVSVTSP